MLLGGWSAGAGSHPAGGSSRVLSLTGLNPAAEAPISQVIGGADPAYRASASAGAVSLSTPAQGTRARFDSAGVTVSSGSMHVGLALAGLGSAAALTSLPPVAPAAAGNRVTYSRGGLSEWYVNGPAGLEQGFTVARAPAGAGPLTLSLAITGNASARPVSARSIDFEGPGGSTLRYGALRAVDAAGHQLGVRLVLRGRTALIQVASAGARYPVRIDPLIQGGKFSAGAEGLFGFSVALSADGHTALVGAPRSSGFAGSAWVFTLTGSTWSEQAELAGTGETGGEGAPKECVVSPEDCSFGRAVALSADGNIALVGAPHDGGSRGAAFAFTREGSAWTRTAILKGGEGEHQTGGFGRSVALSADGSRAIVGAPQDLASRGTVWIFKRTGNAWEQDGPALSEPAGEVGPGRFGYSVAISGETAIVGAPASRGGLLDGGVWAYRRTEAGWSAFGEEFAPSASAPEARFGYSLALAGGKALVGAPGTALWTGAAWVFSQGPSGFEQPVELKGEGETGQGWFGASVALSADGGTALVGAPENNAGEGAAWLMGGSGSGWSTLQELESGEEAGRALFGAGVALSGDGGSALVGGSAAGSQTGAVWSYGSPAAAAPAVTAIHPESGPSAGGTTVVIEGSGFTSGASVTIGVPATSVRVLSSTQIAAKTGADTAGSDEVLVTDSGGSSTGGPSFTYTQPKPVPPTVTSVEPQSGPAAGGSEVTIRGTGFAAGAAVVMGSPAESVKVISATEIRATTTATAAGSYEVVVSDSAGTSEGGPSFTYKSPPPANTNTIEAKTPHIAESGVLATTETELPPPVLQSSGNIKRVTGVIRIKRPGSGTFEVLSPQAHVPFGTVIDASQGRVQVTTEGANGKPQTVTFYGGTFTLQQSSSGALVADLYGGSRTGCPVVKRQARHKDSDGDFDNDAYAHAASSKSGKHVVRKLWTEGHGHYTTKGSYATGAVLGTRWLTEDLCEGTLIYVATDKVLVTNLHTHRKVVVTAHHHLLVKAF